mgnify:CR=1 FL=1
MTPELRQQALNALQESHRFLTYAGPNSADFYEYVAKQVRDIYGQMKTCELQEGLDEGMFVQLGSVDALLHGEQLSLVDFQALQGSLRQYTNMIIKEAR